ncbi:ESX secretion-associated protein EspG [Actinocrispum sp. NPDC049592]|uniref:ESX secretion-associated protein EspG n=1 Tax=Actinocrispum sp. NPDC049592 TaxID=3154835 RepID=UPI003437CB96
MARRTSTARGVVLSHLEFDLLWEDFSDNEPPYPLEVPSHGATMPERDELGGDVYEALQRAGIADETDVDPAVADLLNLLDRPTRSVDALVLGDKARRVLGASKGDSGVLAVLDDAELLLEPVRVTELVTGVMSVIGDLPGGPGEPVRLPREALTAAMDAYAHNGYDSFERTLAGAGVTGRAVRPLATLVESVRTGAGQIAANGPAGRSPILSWYDTQAGRYVVTIEDVGGERLATVGPANGTWMSRRVTAMLTQVSH